MREGVNYSERYKKIVALKQSGKTYKEVGQQFGISSANRARQICGSAMNNKIEWMPINTAPQDGTHILVWEAIYPKHCIAHWRPASMIPAGWQMYPPSEDVPTCEPTHWMPLPTPPATCGTL